MAFLRGAELERWDFEEIRRSKRERDKIGKPPAWHCEQISSREEEIRESMTPLSSIGRNNGAVWMPGNFLLLFPSFSREKKITHK